MSAKQQLLESLIEPVVEGLGFECWLVEFVAQGRHSLLRIYIDKEDGITLEDCEAVSRQVSGVLDVEDPISVEYTLEVSSPGMDRPLAKPEHFEKFAGHKAEIRLRMAFEGKRKHTGVLKGLEGSDVVLVVGEEEYLLPIESIEKACVIPEFD